MKQQHIKCPVCEGRVPVGIDENGQSIISCHFGPHDYVPCLGSGEPAPPEQWNLRDELTSSVISVGYD